MQYSKVATFEKYVVVSSVSYDKGSCETDSENIFRQFVRKNLDYDEDTAHLMSLI